MNLRTEKKKLYTYGGFTGDLKEIANHFGINKGTLNSRLHAGWSLSRALTTPVEKKYAVKEPTILNIGTFRGSGDEASNWFGLDLNSKERTDSLLAVKRLQTYHEPKFYQVNFGGRSYKGSLVAIAEDFGCPLTMLYEGIKAGKSVKDILTIGGFI